MSIITVFSGSFCNENLIIEEVIKRTGYKLITDKEVVAEASRLGVQDFIEKPFTSDVIEGALSSLVKAQKQKN